jgi:hypothetical protein
MSRYVISGGKDGKERLKLLSQVMAPTTTQLLKTAGIGEGMKCLNEVASDPEFVMGLPRIFQTWGRRA